MFVQKRVTCDSARAGRKAPRRHMAWLTRCAHTACTPGYISATSTGFRAAGSRSTTESRSLRISSTACARPAPELREPASLAHAAAMRHSDRPANSAVDR